MIRIEKVFQLLNEFNIELPHQQFHRDLTEVKQIHTRPCTQTFTAVLFTIAKK